MIVFNLKEIRHRCRRAARIFHHYTDVRSTNRRSIEPESLWLGQMQPLILYKLRMIATLSDWITLCDVFIRYSCTYAGNRSANVAERDFSHLVGSSVITVINTRNNTYCLRDSHKDIEKMLFSLLIVFLITYWWINICIYYLRSTIEMFRYLCRNSTITACAFYYIRNVNIFDEQLY